MAHAHYVKAARKDYPEQGIKKGESYYWWKFKIRGRGGAKRYSKLPPRRSQLTQSDFWQTAFSIQEGAAQCPEPDDVESEIESLKNDLESLRDGTQEKYDNLPDGLRSGSPGELLEARVQAVDDAISALDAIDVSFSDEEREEGESEEDYEERVEKEKEARVMEIWYEARDALDFDCD